MMKTACLLLVLLVAAQAAPAPAPAAKKPASAPAPKVPAVVVKAPAPGPVPAGPLTVGTLVDSLCPDIKKALGAGNFTTLNAILAALTTTAVTLPANAGEKVVVVAPTDAAFNAALATLKLTAADALKNPKVLSTILVDHILVTADGKNATTLGKNAATIAATAGKGTVDVANSLAPVAFDAAVNCAKEGQTAYVAKEVITPKAVLAALAPAPVKPLVPTPSPAPKPAVRPIAPAPARPSGGATTSTFTLAAGAAVVAALLA